MKYICIPCGYLYEEQSQENPLAFAQLEDDWQCPDCGTAKSNFTEFNLEASAYDE